MRVGRDPDLALEVTTSSAISLAGMITEHAVLLVRAGQGEEFEAAFLTATAIISSMHGFQDLTLSRCIERDSTYLLLVHWDTLADHTEGFRGSPEYQQWRELLHHFYDPFPEVDHYETVLTV